MVEEGGERGTVITGRVINHKHIENKMKQRQTWTTGQRDNGPPALWSPQC